MRTNIKRLVAEHEAAHAVAAMRMGLPVAWVTIESGYDEGVNFGAAVKIPDELIDLERDKLAICVAMAAPSHLDDHAGTAIGHYAHVEAQLSYEIAGRAGITVDEVYDRCAEIVSEHYVEIGELSDRLVSEGRVVFATA